MTTSSDNDEAEIRGMIHSVNEEMFKAAFTNDAALFDSVWEKYWVPDAVIIRPSGNPMNKEIYKKLMTDSSVCKHYFSTLLSIDSVRLFADGKAAVAVFTTHEKFNYMGTYSDVIAKRSVVLEKQNNGNWLCIHGQRAIGQPVA